MEMKENMRLIKDWNSSGVLSVFLPEWPLQADNQRRIKTRAMSGVWLVLSLQSQLIGPANDQLRAQMLWVIFLQ